MLPEAGIGKVFFTNILENAVTDECIGFSPDPVLTGVGMRETIQGIQDSGVIATAKHFIMNEQEHYRDFIHSNVDDKTMHELYLWYVSI